jgi:hypothetical protein
MKVIDSRSGEPMTIGTPVVYPDGERVTILEIEPGILRARARAQMTYRDHGAVGAPLVTKEEWVPLAVRWTHPAFFGRHVAFFPS